MTKQSRIVWLDGLRGLACICIFLHHFSLAFFPAMFYGEAVPSRLGTFDAAVAQSPFSFLLNGNYMVALFCMISGFVISVQIMNLQDKNRLSDIVIKRYFRLMLPVFAVGFLVFLLSNLRFFFHMDVAAVSASPWLPNYYKEPIGFFAFLRSALVDTWFLGTDLLSTAFWMLSKMFFGTFLCVILSCICWRYQSRAWIVYLFVSFCFFARSELYLAFTLGTLIAWAYVNQPRVFQKYAGVAALIFGLFLGAFPSGVVPTNVYRYFYHALSHIDWHIIGAGLTLYGLFSCASLQKLFSLRPFQFLGKISYAVYLLHIPLTFSFSCFAFVRLIDTVGYVAAAFLSLAATLVLLVVLSFLFHKYVERACAVIQQKLMERVLSKKSNG